MNREEIEKEDRGISISMPLLTEKEMLEIDNNFNEIVNEVSKQYIKEKRFSNSTIYYRQATKGIRAKRKHIR